ncbi:MAG: hypothetical protein IT445_09435 [Phycisphaeraceae bacterium]|nr:hypothetical protein [Phycisphaeraceae bacterium]
MPTRSEGELKGKAHGKEACEEEGCEEGYQEASRHQEEEVRTLNPVPSRGM